MGDYKLSIETENDISSIYEYGIQEYGLENAQSYILGLDQLFQILVENPDMGWDASEFSPFLKRFTYRSHIVFYKRMDLDIFIVRVLHLSMDYKGYL